MSWMLLTLHNRYEKVPEWLEWAKGGLRFLEEHGFDSDGRMGPRAARPLSGSRTRTAHATLR